MPGNAGISASNIYNISDGPLNVFTASFLSNIKLSQSYNIKVSHILKCVTMHPFSFLHIFICEAHARKCKSKWPIHSSQSIQ